ncbi:DNA integrity scanning diadenylate cyclase DisA [Pullulanibacillus sp. KACC 23026]|uniref:DNA integrity scanning diadenylate cyclase DisA n=1 Tax=Pullulanibacillus sp. KACC 23026 TaxID=3028315 RepID=UPI0023AEF470|nr:DNA integrity scanning diadenylate cyclase DisA [Pullulanibacillus sp. KACC 23026]WEG12697.1 DNA integrity scanning diadenylate cyclase DisA [Pullulanibacillus sp. KACC 23026]
MGPQQRRIINDILKMVAPGTKLREGIDNVLRAGTGGLVVIGYDEKVKEIVEGGFRIQCPYTPANLYELAKMDGAIILSEDASTILRANTQLDPHSSIPSDETGIRHRTAERTAKQTGKLVVSISQRRGVITLYKGNIRYSLKDIGVIFTKANQAMQTLEKYRRAMDRGLVNLGALEFEELVTFQEIAQVIHRMELVLRIRDEIYHYVNELGTEGRLISMQLSELVENIEDETRHLIMDYAVEGIDVESVLQELRENGGANFIKLLGYEPRDGTYDDILFPRGYRILGRIPRLPQSIIHNLVQKFGNLNEIAKATIEDLDEVEGIGEKRAHKIKGGLERIQEQLFIDRMF